LEIQEVDFGTGCIKILFAEPDIKAANCENSPVKEALPSLQFYSTYKYLI
jgi:hypothetical protein